MFEKVKFVSLFTLRNLKLFVLPLVFLIITFITITDFDFSSDLEGLYLLKCDSGHIFDLQSDLFLNDETRLIARIEFESILSFFGFALEDKANHVDIHYKWSKKTGRGFVINHFPDNRKILTCFSRFKDSDGLLTNGLFVGGGLPVSKHEGLEVTMNETGMAFFDGKEWKHLWCSVNEAIASASSPDKMYPPSSWRFLGSSVLAATDQKLVLKSSHEVLVEGVPLRVDRFAFFRAGDTYFTLISHFRNVGTQRVNYFYIYGDEPWVGEYGTSVGNVGWTEDRLYYYEGKVDLQKYHFAGMVDSGNKMTLGGHVKYSNIANFIEWLGPNRPDVVYFSNKLGQFADESAKIPLYDKNNRVIFLQWGPKSINPGEVHSYGLAIGMAGNNPKTAFPVKPPVWFDENDMKYLR
jgi:hypothetical protein